MTSITRERVEELMDFKLEEGIVGKAKDPKKRPPPRPVAPKTLNKDVTEVDTVLNHARPGVD